jgi:hypothetical protein
VLTLAFVACAVLILLVASAPRALAFPSTTGGQFAMTCDNAGCHSGGADAPAVSLVSTDGATATYNVMANGIEWAVFNGATHVAGGLNGGSNSFTMPVGATYGVIDVLGDPGTASSGRTTVVGGTATYTITPSAGANGSITPAKTVGVVSGSSATFTITANAGYHVNSLTVDGGAVTPVTSYTFSNVTANHTIAATFAADQVTTYTITPSAGAGGTISPATAQTVASGSDVTFTITPSAGYQVDAVTADGAPVTLTAGTYTFTNVTADHTIAATFKLAAPTKCTATITLTGLKAGVLRRGKTVTIKGTVKPAHSGSAKITIQRKAGTRWVAAKSVTRPMNATSGAYSYGYKPTKIGTYRVKTSVAKTALYTAATTAYKTFKVK